MDINLALENISKMERLQAQLELRVSQYKEEERILNDQLSKMGIPIEELDTRIAALTASVQERLTFIENIDKKDSPNA